MGEEALSQKSREALRHIRNWIMQYGRAPSVRELMNEMKYKSSRSALLLMDELVSNGFLEKKVEGSVRLIKDLDSHNTIRTVSIPLVGAVPCGSPFLAEENIEAMIPVSDSLVRPGNKYFFLKAVGNSMDKAEIYDGDLILIKQQQVANNGENVVALIDGEATVKEFHREGNIVMLLPRSTESKHQPIILTQEFQIQGVVIATVPISKK